MAMQRLADSMAFTSGASLWLMPNAKHSIWSRKIDWYLNFQAGRSMKHTPPLMAPDFLGLLSDAELEPPTLTNHPTSPLMIASGHRLPAEQAVQIFYDGDLAQWIQSAKKVWLDLGKPSARLFLPEGVDLASLTAGWPEHEEAAMTVVAS